MRKLLHLGLRPPLRVEGFQVFHCKAIEIVARDPFDSEVVRAFKKLPQVTHLIFTSQEAVSLFFSYLSLFGFNGEILSDKVFLAIGAATASAIRARGEYCIKIAEEQTLEGVIALVSLEIAGERKSSFLWPRSALSRSSLSDFFKELPHSFEESIFYDTTANFAAEPPPFAEVDAILYTSPSTVDAFLALWGPIPCGKEVYAIGPITLQKLLRNSCPGAMLWKNGKEETLR